MIFFTRLFVGNLRCIMAFGTGYRPSLFWIARWVRTCEIHVASQRLRGAASKAARHRTADISPVSKRIMVVQTSPKVR